ncbi:unnamed protein product [Cylicostephanus goldi]|uniref:G-protein coupled receptors family 1 profile domain-containing protein n=1 Tax=Cylicostephanus goldi TaxID=71465 RepID=A0A3P6QYJ1_CYLGO|nr:unnamed protein product [Cylicostephanus goldi]
MRKRREHARVAERIQGLLRNSSPSDRLRAYISVLAIVDLTVLMVLLVRTIYLSLPELLLDTNSCRAMFVIEQTVKLASLTLLSCISIERYITIRKPFCSQLRKRFVRLTPIAALALLCLVVMAILVQMQSVATTSDSLNCVRMYRGRTLPRLGAYLTAMAFLSNLTTISVNYGQIVRHVKRKFTKRKARGYFYCCRVNGFSCYILPSTIFSFFFENNPYS